MVFVDSNAWCYYFNSSAEEHEDFSKFLDKLIDSDEVIHVNTVILMEVGHFLVKNLGKKDGKNKLDVMMKYDFEISELNFSMARRSLELLKENHQTGIGGRDATIVASMKEMNVEKLITHDKAFKKIDDIEVIDPFEQS